ncbi:unnamed protein product [Phytophthora lilii]|uniref:Unnamed protein product n=1 Tax=Phytophthora lilii TaxID=2077276 RepID=A0A9W6XH14_9STRA|nr:unnamed protein product [Phytophthora lilii]
MKRIRLPFEIVTSSVKLVESVGDQQQHARMNLSIEVKSDSKCVVQVFWNVKASSLEGAHQSLTNASMNWPIKRRTEFIDAILPTRAALRAIHAVRSLPGKLYEMDFASKPHQLLDDDNSKSNVDETIDVVKKGRAESNLTRLFVAGDSYHSRSVIERRGVNEFVASIPNVVFTNSGAVAVVESSIVATDCEDEKPVAPSVDEPRYACVVAIGSPHFFESAAGPKSSGSWLKRRLSGSDRIKGDEEDEVLCQCVAIDFLPTPARPSRTPAIVKKLLLTATDAFTSQVQPPGPQSCSLLLTLMPCRRFSGRAANASSAWSGR